MPRTYFAIPALLIPTLLSAVGFVTSRAWSQQPENQAEFAAPPDVAETDWEYRDEEAYRPDPRLVIHQKSQWIGQQRMGRLAAMRWYGMSNARPTAAATPFTSLYSPVWQMPGGRPFGWHTRGTTVVVTSPVGFIYR
jgi:hypothetical protein